MEPFRRFLVIAAVVLTAATAAAAAVNIVVDPYAIFGTPRVPDFNELKPFAGDRGRIAKIYEAVRARPHALIVGNSRPEMGLDPGHPCWEAEDRPVFNISLPGSSVHDQIRYAQHGIAAGEVRKVLLAVDFADFLSADTGAPEAGIRKDDLPLLVDADGSPNPAYGWQKAKNYLEAALSLDTFVDSLLTIARQDGPFTETRTSAGFNPSEAIYLPVIRREGVPILFAQKNREMMARFVRSQAQLPVTDWGSAAFTDLRVFLRQARAQGIEVILFVNPYHAEYLASIGVAGLWPKFETWFARLAGLADSADVPLWTFVGFDRFSSESPDSVAARGESMAWFWEPAHYKRELGDKMLATMLGPGCPAAMPGEAYGVRLTTAGLRDYLEDLGRDFRGYLTANRDVAERLKEAQDLVLR